MISVRAGDLNLQMCSLICCRVVLTFDDEVCLVGLR